jgi:transposase InsO family protein
MHKLARLTPTGRSLMIRRVEAGETVSGVAEGLWLSATTVYRWWRRYRTEGEAGLQDRSSRPHHSPRARPRWQRRQIRHLRQQRWSSLRIARALRLPVSTVVHIQRQLGLARLERLEPRHPVIRYERRRPGALVHVDVKQLGRIGRIGHRIHGDRRRGARGIGWEYVHVAVDDATRLAYAEIYPDQTAASATAFLDRATRWFAAWGITVRAVMTDNGAGFRGRRFAARRRQLRLAHVWTRPHRPQTNGKAERFIRTALAEWAYAQPYRHSLARASALSDFLRYYNRARPHSALGYRTPAQRLTERL